MFNIFYFCFNYFSKNIWVKFSYGKSAILNQNDLDLYAEFAKKCGVGKNSTPFPDLDKCVIGKNQQNYEVAIFGDSHAGHYSPAITRWAERNNLSVMSFYLFLCSPLLSEEKDSYEPERCQDYREKIWQILQKEHHIKYVFLASRWYDISDSKEVFKNRLEKTIQKISSLNKKLIIMGRVPDFEFAGLKTTPLKCLEKNLIPLQKIIGGAKQNCADFPRENFAKQIEYEKILKEVVSKYKNAAFFDPFQYLCDEKKCYAIKDNKLIYADKEHLNINGANYIGEFELYKTEK